VDQAMTELDWTQITFASLSAVNGVPADQYFKLGQFAELGELSISDIQQMSETTALNGTLYNSGLVRDTTLRGLSESLYAHATRIGDVPGLAEYITQQSQMTASSSSVGVPSALTVQSIAQMSLSNLLTQYPSMSSINFGNTRLSDIPGSVDHKIILR